MVTYLLQTLRLYCVKNCVSYCINSIFYYSPFYRPLKSQFHGKRYILMMSRSSKHVSKRNRCWFYSRPNFKCLPQCFFLVDKVLLFVLFLAQKVRPFFGSIPTVTVKLKLHNHKCIIDNSHPNILLLL